MNKKLKSIIVVPMIIAALLAGCGVDKTVQNTNSQKADTNSSATQSSEQPRRRQPGGNRGTAKPNSNRSNDSTASEQPNMQKPDANSSATQSE